MANQEAFTLDSLALNDGTTFAVDQVSWPPPRQRQNWIGAADSEAQLLFRNPLHENRKVTLRVAVLPQASMDLALGKIATVLDKLQKASKYTDGIGLVWTPATATLSCTFDVLSGEITDLPIDWDGGWLALAPTFTIELTCKPYWRGTETLTSTSSSSTPFVAFEIAGVTGDIPALGRLIVTDTATQSRRHVEWGLEGPLTYNSATSLLIDSDDMVTTGFTGVGNTPAGAYDPNSAGSSAVTGNALNTPTAIAGLGNLSHVGVFRVKARVRADTTGGAVPTLQFRLTWRAADGPYTSNAWAAHTTGNATYQELDLGTITIPVAVAGTQRWTGQVEAMTATAAYESATVDYLTLIPASDGYGLARAVSSLGTGTLSAFDDFVGTTSGVALNARTAPLGGAWATSGDATDYQFNDLHATEQVIRLATGATAGRIALLGSSLTDSDTEALVQQNGMRTGMSLGIVARATDINNHLRYVIGDGTPRQLRLEQVIAGVVTVLQTDTTYQAATAVVHRLKMVVFASGRVVCFAAVGATGALRTIFDTTVAAAVTAGALASGKSGLFDRNPDASGSTREWNNYAVQIPAPEPIVLYSGRNMQIRYDDVIRQDSTATYTGRPPSYRGSRFLVPVGTSRVLVKARRNDIGTAADNNVTDATQVQVGWTPRGLAVPR